MRIFVAVATAATVLTMSACGSNAGDAKSPSGLTTNEVNEKGWNATAVDDQLQICAAYQITPKVVVTAMYQGVTTIPGESVALLTAFMDEKCS